MQEPEPSVFSGVGEQTGPTLPEPSSPPVKLEPRVESDAATADAHKAPRDVPAPSQPEDSSSLTRIPDLKPTAEQNLHTPMKKTNPPSMPSIPQSMEGFDPPLENTKNISPHMRIPPPSPSVPFSMRELDYKEPPETPIRKKETVRIRRTGEGWVEVDEQEEKDLEEAKEAKEAANAAAGTKPEDTVKQEPIKREPENEEQKAKEPQAPSTQAQWQNFAGTASADAAAATSFKVINLEGLLGITLTSM